MPRAPQRWIGDVLELLDGAVEAPLSLLAHDAERRGALNELFLASRETAELRAETVQMGYSLTQLLRSLGAGEAFQIEDAGPIPRSTLSPSMRLEHRAAARRWSLICGRGWRTRSWRR